MLSIVDTLTSIPGGPEMLVLVLMALFATLFIGTAVWLHRDADARGARHPTLWAIGIPLGLIFYIIPGVILLAIYLFSRGDRRSSEAAA